MQKTDRVIVTAKQIRRITLGGTLMSEEMKQLDIPVGVKLFSGLHRGDGKRNNKGESYISEPVSCTGGRKNV